MFSTIDWEIKDEVGHLVLNQPPTNRMNLLFFEELDQLTTNIIPQSKIKALLIYGKGRHFSSGAELTDIIDSSAKKSESENIMFERLSINNRSFLNLYKLPIPVVSAIKGICLGSAFEMVLFSHFRLSSQEAILGLPEVTFDLMPGCGGTQRLTELLGKAKAIEMILSGNSIMAEEALSLKIVDKIIAKKELIDFSLEFIRQIADGFSHKNIPFYKQRLL
ncbi:MAG: enoyl-CoA hydratase/isomerase family protein [Bacteroidota bacterium]